MSEPTALRLPKDTMIEFRGIGEHATYHIRMTLETVGHVEALREVIEKAILPLMQMNSIKLGTGSESATGPAQCDTSSPAREQSEGTDSAQADTGRGK